MSEDNNAADTSTSCCASCGIAEVDDVKLRECDDCDLVRYCGDECQRDHKPEHEEACKKRAAELRDELLFKQPENSHFGDCPICCLPLPLNIEKSMMYMCCSKIICNGCARANRIREMEMRRVALCPFCRDPATTKEENDKLRMKRVEAGDPEAIRQEGMEEYNKKDYFKAFEYWKKGAELGDAETHYQLAGLYHDGDGVEEDKEKEIHHLEEAAIGGHPMARYNLGRYEWNYGNPERAVKHYTIAATQGCDFSIKALIDAFKDGYVVGDEGINAAASAVLANDIEALTSLLLKHAEEIKRDVVSKEELAVALRAHKAAVDATKSLQRAEAEKYRRK